MRIFRLIMITLLLTTARLSAQELTHELDSLISTVDELPDSLKAERYNRINWRSRYKWPLIALQNSQKAIHWALLTHNYTELSKGYSFAGLVERNIENYNEAMRYFNKGMEISMESHDSLQIGHSYNNIGSLYLQTGDTAKALENLRKAYNMALLLNNKDLLAYSSINFGILYTKQGKYDLAEQYFRLTAEARKGEGFSKNSKMSVNYYLIDLFMKRNQLDSAKKSLYLFHKVYIDTMQTWLSDSWRILCDIYRTEENYDSSLFCGKMALKYGYQLNDYQYILSANNEINKTLLAMKDYSAAADSLFRQVGEQDTVFQKQVESHRAYLKYSSDYLAQQAEIDKKNEESRLRSVVLTIVMAILVCVIIMVVMMNRNSKKIIGLNHELANKQEQLDSSLHFAQKIQEAMLPEPTTLGTVFSERFLLFKPRDGVSGDFFWKFEDPEYEIIAVADCTGHGVPGASVSMIGSTSLLDIAKNGERDASQILEKLRSRIKTLLHQNEAVGTIQDGMDIELIVINKAQMTLEFSGAYNSLLLIRNNELFQLDAVRCPIGIYKVEKPFQNRDIQLMKNDCIYMMSDGYTSQFGGPDGGKMRKKDFIDIVSDIHNLSMEKQYEMLNSYFEKWRGSNDQVDDVTVAGFRV